jgi:hypothetical protein
MAKKYDDSVFDAALAELATANIAHVTSAEPANHAGIAAVSLADIAVTAGLAGGDWSAAANGDVSGRKTTLAEQAAVTVDASGTATHVVTSDGTTLQSATTCTSQALTSGNTVTIPAHDYEFEDPT